MRGERCGDRYVVSCRLLSMGRTDEAHGLPVNTDTTTLKDIQTHASRHTQHQSLTDAAQVVSACTRTATLARVEVDACKRECGDQDARPPRVLAVRVAAQGLGCIHDAMMGNDGGSSPQQRTF
jgi:hypothetical protein